ncbi:hypothetical protein GLOIN_2v1565536, partial [Rhizophagus irregularis DAOM 181602=DAOM 197198]
THLPTFKSVFQEAFRSVQGPKRIKKMGLVLFPNAITLSYTPKKHLSFQKV